MTHHVGVLVLASFIVALGLSGCGSSGQDTAALALTPVPSGKARVTVKRESALFAAACPAAITAGTQKVADISNGGQAIFDIPPVTPRYRRRAGHFLVNSQSNSKLKPVAATRWLSLRVPKPSRQRSPSVSSEG